MGQINKRYCTSSYCFSTEYEKAQGTWWAHCAMFAGSILRIFVSPPSPLPLLRCVRLHHSLVQRLARQTSATLEVLILICSTNIILFGYLTGIFYAILLAHLEKSSLFLSIRTLGTGCRVSRKQRSPINQKHYDWRLRFNVTLLKNSAHVYQLRTFKLAPISQEVVSGRGHGSYILNNVILMDLIQIAMTEQQIAHR